MSCCHNGAIKIERAPSEEFKNGKSSFQRPPVKSEMESSYNAVIPISIVLEAGMLVFSVASYVFTVDKEVAPYGGNYLRLEEIFIAFVSFTVVLNVNWLFYYRMVRGTYSRKIRICRLVEGLIVLAAISILSFNAFKVDSDCLKTNLSCHKIEAKLFAVGLGIVDVILHGMDPVENIRGVPVVVVTRAPTEGTKSRNGSMSQQGNRAFVHTLHTGYRPRANSVAVKVGPLTY